MSKNQLKPSINPEEYDYEEYSYRQNSLSAFYRDDEDERDYDLETDHRVQSRPGGRRSHDDRDDYNSYSYR